MNKKDFGEKGEGIAKNYLIKSGYKIIEKNFRTNFGEIDLICEKDSSIIFIEVRTKRESDFLLPEESITKRKIKHIKLASLEYLSRLKKVYKEIKFEFIGILFKNDNEYEINHIKDFIL